MSLNEDYENRKERKEKKKVQREKLATFFYNIAQLSFAGLAIGIISQRPVEFSVLTWGIAVFGILMTVVFALIGNKILN